MMGCVIRDDGMCDTEMMDTYNLVKPSQVIFNSIFQTISNYLFLFYFSDYLTSFFSTLLRKK